MKIISRENINTQKWDELVKSAVSNSVFSLSTYLDAVAENWCILTDENYTKGIALPFTIRLGVKICYTPIFVRYLEWFGEKTLNAHELSKLIQNEFQQGQLSSSVNFSTNQNNEFIYQSINVINSSGNNSQAKRMLTKFEKSGMIIEEGDSVKEILEIIKAELPQKIASINDKSLSSLNKLVKDLKDEKLLRLLIVKDKEKIVGGLFLVQFNNSLLYLKGAFSADSKKEGAMYATMISAIEMAKKNKCDFDFGGSRVEGVRRFNVNLGGQDCEYYSLEWDNAPLWFKLIKKAKQAWIKK